MHHVVATANSPHNIFQDVRGHAQIYGILFSPQVPILSPTGGNSPCSFAAREYQPHVKAVAYPGGFLVARTPSPGHFFKING